MKAKMRVATSESQVNFEAMWQTWPEQMQEKQRGMPRLLGEARERKLYTDRRYLPNVISRIRASRQLRVWRRTVPRHMQTRAARVRTRRQQIAAELGLYFSTCTLAQARYIVSGCNKAEKQTILSAFFSLQHWRNSRLGQELAPALRRLGI